MRRRTLLTLTVALPSLALLAACSDASSGGHGHDMPHELPLPSGMTDAPSPTYPVGTKVTVRADHMPGMDGAAATVTGVYDTWVYSVNYDPTDGSARVEGHQWVVQEELRDPKADDLPPGTRITIDADHAGGMKGAEGTVHSTHSGPVYVVTYTPTDGGDQVVNHRWLVESELSPA